MLRWRTGLILREMESEIEAMEKSREIEAQLRELMGVKTGVDTKFARLRLERQRLQNHYGPAPSASAAELEAAIRHVTEESQRLDAKIAPLAKCSGEMGNPTWGPLMRAGNDKSLFARQVERYADVYTSRVFELPCPDAVRVPARCARITAARRLSRRLSVRPPRGTATEPPTLRQAPARHDD